MKSSAVENWLGTMFYDWLTNPLQTSLNSLHNFLYRLGMDCIEKLFWPCLTLQLPPMSYNDVFTIVVCIRYCENIYGVVAWQRWCSFIVYRNGLYVTIRYIRTKRIPEFLECNLKNTTFWKLELFPKCYVILCSLVYQTMDKVQKTRQSWVVYTVIRTLCYSPNPIKISQKWP
jgi:hypothetical protein